MMRTTTGSRPTAQRRGGALRRTALRTAALSLAAAVLLAGCGGGDTKPRADETSPSEAASFYLEAMRGNVADLKDYNPDTEITEVGAFEDTNQTLLDTWGAKATSEQKAQLTEAMLEGLQAVEFTIGDEQVTGDTATVKVSIRGLDMTSSVDTQIKKFGGQITPATTDAEVVALIDAIWREAPLVEKPADVDFGFTSVSDGRWIADSSSGGPLAAAYLVWK